MKLLFTELYKIWTNRIFIMFAAVLIGGNLFFIWNYSDKAALVPASAYREMTEDLSGLSFIEKQELIHKAHEQISAVVTIDNIRRQESYAAPEYIEALKTEYKKQIQEYEKVYESGTYLKYTDNLLAEFTFLTEINNEILTVAAYEDYLKKVHETAGTLTEISIFQPKDAPSFSVRSIEKTDSAYAGMDGQSVQDYSPQKGLMQALDFRVTDICLILFMLLVSVAAVFDERDKGLLTMVYTLPSGRLKTAAAKALAVVFSILAIVILLYGTNLAYCGSVFGFGNVFREIQSVPALMKSTLQANVLTYIFLFMLAKWAGAAVMALLILLCTILCRRFYTSWCLALAVIGVNFFFFNYFSPLGHFNILKYANLAGILDTNRILGDYQLLYFFGTPVTRGAASAAAFAAAFVLFILLFLWGFASGLFLKGGRVKSRVKKRMICQGSLFKFEAYKTLILGGGLWLILFFAAVSVYQGMTAVSYQSAKDVYYKKYLTEMTGKLTQEKADWFQKEYEKFEPILKLQAALESGMIDGAAYDELIGPYGGLMVEKEAVDDIVGTNFAYLKENKGAQLVYGAGFERMFDLKDKTEADEMVLVLLMMAAALSGIFSMEISGGMDKVITVTPLGKQKTVRTKLLLAACVGGALAVISLVPVYIDVLRHEGLKGLWVPAKSMEAFADVPANVPLVGMLAAQVLLRLAVCLWAAVFISWISLKMKNTLMSTFCACLILCVPTLLASAGLEGFLWLSPYPVFHWLGFVNNYENTWICAGYAVALLGSGLYWANSLQRHFGSEA